MEGSVRKAGDQVRISAQLVDASTGNHLWAHRYDRELRDIFAIQDEVATAIVSTVAGEVQAAGIDQARRKRTDNLLAYDYLLRDLELQKGFDDDDFHVARLMFEKAIASDPNFAQAHALLAIVLVQLFWFEIYQVDNPLMAGLDPALAAAQRAVALDGNDSLCHNALGFVHFGRKSFDLAKYHCDFATRLNPNDADSLAYLAHRHQKSSCPPSSRGRLRSPGQLRRPRSHCPILRPETNTRAGPLVRGWSLPRLIWPPTSPRALRPRTSR